MDLYPLCRPSNDTLENFYKKYFNILTSNIQLAEKLHYNAVISQSVNKTKTARSVIRSLTNKQGNKNEELMLNSEGKLIKNTQSIADAFNNYFDTVVEESIIKVIKQDKPSQEKTHEKPCIASYMCWQMVSDVSLIQLLRYQVR